MWLLNSFYCTSKLEAQKNLETQISEALLNTEKAQKTTQEETECLPDDGFNRIGMRTMEWKAKQAGTKNNLYEKFGNLLVGIGRGGKKTKMMN